MKKIIILISEFLKGQIDGEIFSTQFIDCWRLLGKTGEVLQINQKISESLSTIFCFADLFNPNEDREDYEFDEDRLRNEVQKVFHGFSNDL